MSKRILLTGGRAPAALELGRLFAKQGHIVYLAESVRFPVTRFSNSITRYFRVPEARFKPREYGRALAETIAREHIDVFIPTCEEIFYVAKASKNLPSQCVVWADTFDKLDMLHNKWTFIEYTKKIGLKTPSTYRASSRNDLHAYLTNSSSAKLIVKPAYSRFATQTLIWSRGSKLPDTILPTEVQPWIAQQFIDGRHLCTYSLAYKGKLLAHSIYESQQQWGIGSSTVFEYLDHPIAQKWVERFISETNFTGQIGFDFIETLDDTLYPIECNPRSTSGIHFFNKTPELAAQFLGAQNRNTVTPRGGDVRSVKFALVVRLIRLVIGRQPVLEWKKTWHFLRQSSDVLYESGDFLPVLGQIISLVEFLRQSVWLGVSPTEVATRDCGYNGIDESNETV